MRIFGLGITELLVILVIALFIFGPVALPKLSGMAGNGMRKLRERANWGLEEEGAERDSGGEE